MGTSRLPNQIPIPKAIRLQEKVFCSGGIAALIAVGAFAASNGGLGVLAGAVAFGLFWAGSKIKTHKRAVAEGKLYD